MNHLTIRIGTKEDAESIAVISRQTFIETFAGQNSKEDMAKFLDEQFTTEALMEEVGAPENMFFLTFVNKTLAGYVRLRQGVKPAGLESCNAIEIARIYVLQSMIGQGVGKALMEKSIDVARQQGKEIIWLGVWEKNSRAIQFYTGWGFQKFGEHDFILGNDVQQDWLMKKLL